MIISVFLVKSGRAFSALNLFNTLLLWKSKKSDKDRLEKLREEVYGVVISPMDKKVEIDEDYDEVAIVNESGEIIFSTGDSEIVDIFSVFPNANRVIVESDLYENYIRLERGFVYIKSKRVVDVTEAKELVKKLL